MIESGKIKRPGYLWRKLKDRVETLAILPANGSTIIVGQERESGFHERATPVAEGLWWKLPDYDVETCAQDTGGNIDTEETIHGVKLHVCSYRPHCKEGANSKKRTLA